MTENDLLIRSASIKWLHSNAHHFTHAVTLTLKPYRKVLTERGEMRDALTANSAQRTFHQFLNRLNVSIFGNEVKRRNKSVHVIPVLEGQATHKILHFHCAIGNFPLSLTEKDIAEKIKDAWHKTEFGNEQVDIQEMFSVEWLDYCCKEIGINNADVLDWTNVRLPATSLN